MDEYAAVRYANIALFNGLDDQALLRRGVANDETVTVRGIAYHIVSAVAQQDNGVNLLR